MVIAATYESDLTTMMTIQPRENAIRSFSDVIETGRKLFVEANTNQESMLRNAPPGHPLNTIFKTMGRDHFLDDSDCLGDCIESLLRVR